MNEEQVALEQLRKDNCTIHFKHWRYCEAIGTQTRQLAWYSRTNGWGEGELTGEPDPRGGLTECAVRLWDAESQSMFKQIGISQCHVRETFSYGQGRRYSLLRVIHSIWFCEGWPHMPTCNIKLIMQNLCRAVRIADPTLEDIAW